jgi:uncharacterized protein GlcG (DUF336 family)
MKTVSLLSALALSAVATAASAQAVRTERNVSLELANQVAAGAVAACTAGGYNVAATVVDRAGTVRAVQRADNAGPHTLEASRLKAYTSASAKNNTLAMMEGAQKNPAAANLVNIPGYLLLGGGVPIRWATKSSARSASAARPAATWMNNARWPRSTRSRTS